MQELIYFFYPVISYVNSSQYGNTYGGFGDVQIDQKSYGKVQQF